SVPFAGLGDAAPLNEHCPRVRAALPDSGGQLPDHFVGAIGLVGHEREEFGVEHLQRGVPIPRRDGVLEHLDRVTSTAVEFRAYLMSLLSGYCDILNLSHVLAR